MRWFILPFLLAAIEASAQNWALLNPAYKYNYSNDGSDTISNQIFVTHIDTLGVDSFRYELNRIGVMCDTCPASMGGPCDGCFIWVDQPQFLQRSVIVSTGRWLFVDPDTFLIRIDLPIGSSWPFDPVGSVTATFDSQATDMVFGDTDSTRTILLSTGDSIRISVDHGILELPGPSGEPRFGLIGIEGPETGSLLPKPLDFFHYGPGDELQYRIEVQYYDPGNQFPFQNASQQRKIRIWDVDSIENGYAYHYALFTSGYFPPEANPPNWMDFGPSYTWNVTTDYLSQAFAPVFGYPNAMAFGDCANFPPQGDTGVMMLTLHSLDEDGRYSIDPMHKPVDDTYGNQIFLDYSSVPGHPELYPFGWFGGAASFKAGIGLIAGSFTTNFEGGCWIDLVGAQLNGVTIGTLTPDEQMNGPLTVPERLPTTFSLNPIPATDELFLNLSGSANGIFRILTASGHIVRQDVLGSGTRRSIDVSDMPDGLYVLHLSIGQASSTQRFTIAR